MKQTPKSEGKCFFYGGTFTKAGINCHLQIHLRQKVKENAVGQSYLVKIETDPHYGGFPYFLSLWLNGNTTMKNIDDFLRDIWLECCVHLSVFTNPKNRKQNDGIWGFFETVELLEKGKQKEYEKLMEESNDEVPMSRKTDKVFYKGLKLEYEYDFGSSTDLLLTVVEDYPVKADKKIVLLSRNEPLEWLCDTCAEKHAKKCEDFSEYAAMPVVNSPRMGVCGYEGGVIDIERDVVFVKG
jgi:hypothetical protein